MKNDPIRDDDRIAPATAAPCRLTAAPSLRHRRGLLAGATAFGLLAGALVLPSAQAAELEPTVLLQEDFEDGAWDPLVQNGGPTLSVIPEGGDKALLVQGRANDYDGVKTPANLLQPGGSYTMSAQVRLAGPAGTTASARFVVEPSYSWVGNTTVTSDAWTTVSGTFDAPAGADPATLRAYIGTSALAGPYDYLLDDIVITGTAAPAPVTWQPTPDASFVSGGAVGATTTPVTAARGTGNRVALTFDDGPNPGETTAILDLLKARGVRAVFCVIGQNVQQPGGAELLRRIVAEGHTLCNHGTSYADMGSWTQAQIETDLKATLRIIRDAVGDPSLAVPYFRAPNGSWGATGAVAAALGMQPLGLGSTISDWDGNDLSEATLTANLRAAFTPGAIVLAHDGGGDRSNTVKAVTTVVTEKQAEGWEFVLPQGGAAASVQPGLSSDFEDGLDGWAARGDGVQVATSTDAHSGSGALLVTNRTQPWHGATIDVTAGMPVGTAVGVAVWAKLAPGQSPAGLKISVQRDNGDGSAYEGVAGAGAQVTADGWVLLSGTYTLAAAADRVQIYVEGPVGVGFLLDDFVLEPIVETPIQTDVPALKDVLGAAGIEHVGVAIDARETVGTAADLLRKHYNAFTPENAGKPESVQPVEGQFTFTQLDQLLDFADAEGIDVYGHVLAWHSQTPAWFFLDGTRPLTSSPADQALLKSRMRAHIAGIAAHLDARYPDGDSPIWAWDVVNEVIADGDTANPHDMRDSRWFQVLGEGFVDEAFRLADEYFPSAELFINDYNTEMPEKRADYVELIAALQARGVPIDGVGHQAHVDVARPVQWLEDSIEAVEKLDPTLLQAITELDVNASTENQGADVSGAPVDPYSPAFEDDEDAAAEVGYYYRDLFAMLREHDSSIESVTFWGISNARSWLRTWPMARPWEQPLPFDDDLQVTPAYWGIVDPTELPARPADVLAPRIADMSDVRAVSNGASGAKVAYTPPSAIDTRDGAVRLICTPPSGSRFSIGTTTVTCTATDAAGNTRTSTFDVIVTRKVPGKP
ncbi:endo-1,4-beta-xylanase [Rathayibacter sp. ZW T2_19]|uniref:Beta-xylanase n=1 Tax=Rathayibacter rubneri TaxID=2950106 RepID=A0A9X2IUL0_9MICO|nr:endo-1,4-beta-xylanase [Rathayibacter rubneri]MCM6762719.1 endo-1,4-beta-xylanase [Rathayibacter rubneri]